MAPPSWLSVHGVEKNHPHLEDHWPFKLDIGISSLIVMFSSHMRLIHLCYMTLSFVWSSLVLRGRLHFHLAELVWALIRPNQLKISLLVLQLFSLVRSLFCKTMNSIDYGVTETNLVCHLNRKKNIVVLFIHTLVIHREGKIYYEMFVLLVYWQWWWKAKQFQYLCWWLSFRRSNRWCAWLHLCTRGNHPKLANFWVKCSSTYIGHCLWSSLLFKYFWICAITYKFLYTFFSLAVYLGGVSWLSFNFSFTD